ncbi:MAG: DUF4836 family protein [Chitinophagaceae bacterium]
MKRNLLPILLATVWVASCGRSDKSGVAVPKDAAVVVQINSKSLSSKLTWQEVKQSEWYKELYNEAPDSLAKKILDDPQNSGINTDADLVLFMRKRGEGGYVVLEGTLKDPASFEALNKQISKENTVEKDGELSVLKTHNSVSTWTPTRFVYVIDAPDMGSRRYRSYDDSDNNDKSKLTTDSLVKFAKELYALKSSDNLTDDNRFNDLLKDGGDIHAWVNSGSLYANGLGDAISMTKFSDLLKDNISTFTVNFDNGKVTAKSKAYYNDDLAKLFKKYKVKDLDAEALGRIASKDVVAALAFNFPPEGLKELIKAVGAEGIVNGALGKEGYSIDEFVKAHKGDLILAVTDLKVKSVQDTIESFNEGGAPKIYTHTKPDMNVLFAVSINDKAAFDKLVNIFKTKLEPEINNNPGVPKISYAINDKWFAISNSKELADNFIAGGSNKQDYISRISGHSTGLFVDLQKVLKAAEEMQTDSLDKAQTAVSRSYLMDAILTGGIDGDIGHGVYELNLVDKQTNSLKQLNQYSDKLHAIWKSKRKAYGLDDVSVDTVATVAPPPPAN